MTNDVKGTVRQEVFAELLQAGVEREELAREMINVARECYASLRLVPQFRKEQGELRIDIVLYKGGSRSFDEVLIQINDAALLAEIGYERPQKHSAPLDAA